MLQLSYFVATVFGSGYLPWMPGTWGSLVCLFGLFAAFWLQLSPFVLLIIAFFLFFVGWGTSQHILKSLDFKDTDPSYIVIDEVVGLITTVGLLGLTRPITVNLLILSFILFRLFDIVKPWPIGWLDEKLAQYPKTASLGIMVDDVLAGIMAAGILWAFWLCGNPEPFYAVFVAVIIFFVSGRKKVA